VSAAQTTARLAGFDWDDLEHERFHRVLVPGWLAEGRGRAACNDLVGVAPLALALEDGRAFTYAADGGELVLREGREGAETVAVFEDAVFREFACEALTAYGLFYTRQARFDAGDLGGLMRWERALRCLWQDRPIFRSDAPAPSGAGEAFALEDLRARPDEVARHFDTHGFVRVRAVLDAREVAELRRECERVRAEAAPGDPRSWWGRDAHGEPVCTRVNYAGDFSKRLGALFEDERIRAIAALCGPGVRPATDRLDGVTAIFKTPDMREGLSDLPWHIDCGTGGHPVMCPLGNLSLHLDDVDAASGDLRAIPGSHRGSNRPVQAAPGEALGVSMGARAGDCTLHWGDLCHAAPPPVGPGPRTRRVSLVLTYPNADLFEVLGPREAYNDVLLGREDGQIESLLAPS